MTPFRCADMVARAQLAERGSMMHVIPRFTTRHHARGGSRARELRVVKASGISGRREVVLRWNHLVVRGTDEHVRAHGGPCRRSSGKLTSKQMSTEIFQWARAELHDLRRRRARSHESARHH